MALSITSTALAAKAGQSQMLPLVTTGGGGVVTWEMADVQTALPPGVQLNATGSLMGAPQCTGVFPVQVRAHDSTSPFPQYAVAIVTVTVT